MIDESVIAYAEHVLASHPELHEMWMSRSEQAFYRAAECALASAMAEVEDGVKEFYVLSEVGLSNIIAIALRGKFVVAVNESNRNGHVDIAIEHPRGNRRLAMLGECKKWRGYKYHRAGCNQLLNRYSTGRRSRGFCLEFVGKSQMYDRMARLRVLFDRYKPLEQVSAAVDHDIHLNAFITVHKHFTGAEVEILHVACNLFHPEVQQPADTETEDDPDDVL